MRQNRKSTSTGRPGVKFPVRAVMLFCLILILGLFALRVGGRVTIKRDSVEISGRAHDAFGTAGIVQRSDASGPDARAVNAVGSVNPASASVPREPVNISQEAVARGNGAQAINAGGDVNLK